ncbi:MAG: hypothetical protein KGL39_01565 [Patescibacteria group bacterium]|nr:hypothetical protein [Patescibacteria group bacterium]
MAETKVVTLCHDFVRVDADTYRVSNFPFAGAGRGYAFGTLSRFLQSVRIALPLFACEYAQVGKDVEYRFLVSSQTYERVSIVAQLIASFDGCRLADGYLKIPVLTGFVNRHNPWHVYRSWNSFDFEIAHLSADPRLKDSPPLLLVDYTNDNLPEPLGAPNTERKVSHIMAMSLNQGQEVGSHRWPSLSAISLVGSHSTVSRNVSNPLAVKMIADLVDDVLRRALIPDLVRIIAEYAEPPIWELFGFAAEPECRRLCPTSDKLIAPADGLYYVWRANELLSTMFMHCLRYSRVKLRSNF